MPRGRERIAVPDRSDPPREPLLSASEVQFLLAAIAHYCATHCPLGCDDAWCPLLTWQESVHSGAIERACLVPPTAWPARLAPLALPA